MIVTLKFCCTYFNTVPQWNTFATIIKQSAKFLKDLNHVQRRLTVLRFVVLYLLIFTVVVFHFEKGDVSCCALQWDYCIYLSAAPSVQSPMNNFLKVVRLFVRSFISFQTNFWQSFFSGRFHTTSDPPKFVPVASSRSTVCNLRNKASKSRINFEPPLFKAFLGSWCCYSKCITVKNGQAHVMILSY